MFNKADVQFARLAKDAAYFLEAAAAAKAAGKKRVASRMLTLAKRAGASQAKINKIDKQPFGEKAARPGAAAKKTAKKPAAKKPAAKKPARATKKASTPAEQLHMDAISSLKSAGLNARKHMQDGRAQLRITGDDNAAEKKLKKAGWKTNSTNVPYGGMSSSTVMTSPDGKMQVNIRNKGSNKYSTVSVK